MLLHLIFRLQCSPGTYPLWLTHVQLVSLCCCNLHSSKSPALPKLVTDSEREFTDLKMALDNLLNPHTELSEHYKYRVLMEQLILKKAKLITQACWHYPTQPLWQPCNISIDNLTSWHKSKSQLC